MEINKIVSHISWIVVASKEKMRFLNQEMKAVFSNMYLKNDKLLNKSQYHLNLARTLLTQVEKNYIVFINNGANNSSLLLRIKNTYLQRCIFQLSMGFDCYKENLFKVEKVSNSLAKSLLNKWYQTVMILNNLINEMDMLIARFK